MRHRVLTATIAGVLLLASCGGGDDASSDEPTTTEPAAPETAAPDATDPPDVPDTDAPDGTEPTVADDYTPGDLSFRLVNLLAEPVDVYVRTQGLVTAYPMTTDVTTAGVTDLFAPPVDGSFVVTTAGSTDPECVIDCPDIVTNLTATAPEGDVRTVIVYSAPEGDAFAEPGTPQTFDLWENPTDERLGNSNSMPAADPASGLFIVSAVAVADADFGLRVSFEGGDGCVESNLSGVLVGGNQTPAFSFDGGSVEVLLHDNNDQECTEEPVGGPFTVTGGAGSRTHLILSGAPGAIEAIVLPFAGDSTTSPPPTDATGAADRDAAIEQMTPEVETNLGLPPDQAACLAELLVDAIGPENILDESGVLIDLDTLSSDFDTVAQNAIVESVDACGVDVNLLGG